VVVQQKLVLFHSVVLLSVNLFALTDTLFISLPEAFFVVWVIVMSLVPASLTNFATTSAEIVVFFVSEAFFTVFSSCARASVTSPLSFFSTVSVAFVSFAIFSNVLSVFRVSDGLIAVKQTSQSGNNGGNSSSGSSTSGGNSGSTTTPDTKPSETRKTDKTFENIAKDTNATLTVEKNDKGEVTDARAQLEKTVKNTSETKKTTISADVVAKLVKEAGTSDITITQTTKNASGKEMNSVSVNANRFTDNKTTE
jgi:hypothetical protein